MLVRAWALLVAVLLVAVLLGAAAPAGAQAPPPPPRAWVLFDQATGRVIDASNEHENRPVASTVKLLTALIALDRLNLDDAVVVSERAASMPARRIGLAAGETWRVVDLLYALLLASANDAAVALADRISGGPEGFARLMAETAEHLGVADHPVLRDPAGLDDGFSFEGGNRISAWDLAVLTRAALARPTLASIVATPTHSFTGGDGRQHRLRNHNRLLTTYPGAVGVKTGYTKRSGRCLVAAATRDGRTLVAVVLDAADTYGAATALLDRGFATPDSALVDRPRLPPLPEPEPPSGTPAFAAPGAVSSRPADPAGSQPWYAADPARAGAILVVGGAPAVMILLRRRRRRARDAGEAVAPEGVLSRR